MPTPRLAWLALGLLATAAVPAGADRPLDDGRLEASYFAPGIQFREADKIDYLWVKPGFTLDGSRLRFAPWPAPEFLGEDAAKRDTKDHQLADRMNAAMPTLFSDAFRGAFGDRLTVVDQGESIRVEGRIDDCSTGSRAAKILVGFGAGAGSLTVDLKFLDAATGDLLMAIHDRVVSGTDWSTTDSKFTHWAGQMAEHGAKKGFDHLYAGGRPARK